MKHRAHLFGGFAFCFASMLVCMDEPQLAVSQIAYQVCGGSNQHEALVRARSMITAVRWYYRNNPNEQSIYSIGQFLSAENVLEEIIKKFKRDQSVIDCFYTWHEAVAKQKKKFEYAGQLMSMLIEEGHIAKQDIHKP